MTVVDHHGAAPPRLWPSEPSAPQYIGSRRDRMWVVAMFDGRWGAAFMQAGAVSVVRVPCLTWPEVDEWFRRHGEPPVDLDRLIAAENRDLFMTLAGWTHRNVSAPTASVYFVQQGASGPIKIGKAANVAARIASLQTANPYPLTLLGTAAGGIERERELHERFAADRLHGEWFAPSLALLDFIESAEVVAR